MYWTSKGGFETVKTTKMRMKEDGQTWNIILYYIIYMCVYNYIHIERERESSFLQWENLSRIKWEEPSRLVWWCPARQVQMFCRLKMSYPQPQAPIDPIASNCWEDWCAGVLPYLVIPHLDMNMYGHIYIYSHINIRTYTYSYACTQCTHKSSSYPLWIHGVSHINFVEANGQRAADYAKAAGLRMGKLEGSSAAQLIPRM